jgi:large subunit ribosomal protein L22
MKASLTNFKQSPRKVRLVADMIRGKNVLVAQDSLRFLPKKSAPELEKLLASAIANARTQGQNPENLFVSKIMVDKGSVIRRFKPMARGRAAGIRRTMSHIVIELGVVAGASEKKAKKVAKKKSTKATK